MKDKNTAVLEKILSEISIAQGLMGSHDMDSFLEDEMVKRAVCMTVINILRWISGAVTPKCHGGKSRGFATLRPTSIKRSEWKTCT